MQPFAGGEWPIRHGLGPPPPSLSVLEDECGGGGARRGRGAEEGGMRVQEVVRRLWIRRHSWQMRT